MPGTARKGKERHSEREGWEEGKGSPESLLVMSILPFQDSLAPAQAARGDQHSPFSEQWI